PIAVDTAAYNAARERVLAAVNDDLGLPQAVGLLNSFGSYKLWVEFDSILGLDIAERSCREEEPLPDAVSSLVTARNEARATKNWKESDALRDQLIALGYEVGDG